MSMQRKKYQNNFEKFNALRDLLQFMQEAMDKEKQRRSDDIAGKGFYQRSSFPTGKKLPVYQWERAMEIAKPILAHLQYLASDDALRFYAELTVAWFYTCPELLLRMTPQYMGDILEHQPTDLDFAEALWLWFQLYLSDPTWFS